VSPHTNPTRFIFAGTRIRCVLAHEHVLLRQGLRRLLEDEPDIEVIGEAGDAAECWQQVYNFHPDVVLADAQTFTGFAAKLAVSREIPHTKFVFLSTQKELRVANGAEAKAEGCDVRETSAEELVQMVRKVCGEDLARLQERRTEGNSQHRNQNLASVERGLTAREEEVLKLLAEGKTVRKAATVLGLSSKTVDSHKFNLMRKLGLHNKAELVMWAVQRKLVKIPANL
jgi:two-component system, NarL family, response regulator NreC